MADCKPADTPMAADLSSAPTLSAEAKTSGLHIPAREAVGALMYAMVATRPDIAAAVGKVAQHVNSPSQELWTAIKRILRYLRGTTSLGICFSGSNSSDPPQLISYADSTWADDKTNRKSTTGYVHMLSSGPISWASKKQATVALSSTEAEYIALAAAVQDLIWLRLLLSELDCPQAATTIFEDNQGCIGLLKNPGSLHHRVKHIDIKHHFLREQAEAGNINLSYISTSDNIADCLTKALGPLLFRRHRTPLLGMC